MVRTVITRATGRGEGLTHTINRSESWAAWWRPLWQNQQNMTGTGLWAEIPHLSLSLGLASALREGQEGSMKGQRSGRETGNLDTCPLGFELKGLGPPYTRKAGCRGCAGQRLSALARKCEHTSQWQEETRAGTCQVHAKARASVCTEGEAGVCSE